MALMDRLKFDSPSSDVLVWKHPSESLRVGSQLIVNESQEAVFVRGGRALDVFGPGTHTLSSGNIPLLSALINFPFGGKTPFSAEVWYISRAARRGLKWGTKVPIPVIDPEFGFPINLRSFGEWGIRIRDSRSFLTQVVGTQRLTTTAQIEEFFVSEILQRYSDAAAKFVVQRSLSLFKLAAYLNDLSRFSREQIAPELELYGVDLLSLTVESVSIPEEETKKFQEVLGRKMEIEQLSTAQMSDTYVRMRQLDAIDKAVEKEGGIAGNLFASSMGLGMGLTTGVRAGKSVGDALEPVGGKPSRDESKDPLARLRELKELHEEGLLTAEEYEEKRRKVIDGL